MLVTTSPPSPSEKTSFLLWVYCSLLPFGLPRVPSPFQCAELPAPGYTHLTVPSSEGVAGGTGAATWSLCLMAGLLNQDEAEALAGLAQ